MYSLEQIQNTTMFIIVDRFREQINKVCKKPYLIYLDHIDRLANRAILSIKQGYLKPYETGKDYKLYKYGVMVGKKSERKIINIYLSEVIKENRIVYNIYVGKEV